MTIEVPTTFTTIPKRLCALGGFDLAGSAHTPKAYSAALPIRWQGHQSQRVSGVSNRPLTQSVLMYDPLLVVPEARFAGVKPNSPSVDSKLLGSTSKAFVSLTTSCEGA